MHKSIIILIIGFSFITACKKWGNLITDSMVVHVGNGLAGIPQRVLHYTYDNNSNPLQLGNEAFLMIDRDWIGCPRSPHRQYG